MHMSMRSVTVTPSITIRFLKFVFFFFYLKKNNSKIFDKVVYICHSQVADLFIISPRVLKLDN